MPKHKPVSIRYIEQTDLPLVVEAEDAANAVHIDDPDFGQVDFVAPCAWREEDFMQVIRQRRSANLGTYDTRTYAVQAMRPSPGEDTVEEAWVCGGFSLEKQDDGFVFAFLTVHPRADVEQVVRAILKDAKGQADRSESRKKVTLYLRDQTGGRFPDFVRAVKAEGFSMKLIIDHFAPDDGWECVFEVK